MHTQLLKFRLRSQQVALIGLVLFGAQSAMAQVQFDETISLVPTRGVETNFAITPDNRTVIYRSDQITEGQLELFAINIDGSSTATKINDSLVERGDVSSFRLSPDGQTVVYIADQEQNSVRELFSAPIDGSRSAIKLNSDLVSGGNVGFNFQVSADNRTVVYLADQDTDDVEEIYSVPIDGSRLPIKLNTPMATGQSVLFFQLSPDGRTAFYISDENVPGKFELYRVAIDGASNPIKLDSESGPNRQTFDFQISSDGQTVLYASDQETEDVFEIYSVALDGSRPIVKLNSPLISGGGIFRYQISPDSQTMIYQADQETLDVHELYSVPIDASGPVVKLSDSTSFTRDPSRVGRIEISPDSQSVVFMSDATDSSIRELFSTRLDGRGSVNKVSGDLTPGGSVSTFSHKISADSKTVFYVADQDIDEVFQLYSVPISGNEGGLGESENSGLSEFIFRGTKFRVSSDGQFLVFNTGFGAGDDGFKLFSVRTSSITADTEFCLPIKAINGNVAVICL